MVEINPAQLVLDVAHDAVARHAHGDVRRLGLDVLAAGDRAVSASKPTACEPFPAEVRGGTVFLAFVTYVVMNIWWPEYTARPGPSAGKSSRRTEAGRESRSSRRSRLRACAKSNPVEAGSNQSGPHQDVAGKIDEKHGARAPPSATRAQNR